MVMLGDFVDKTGDVLESTNDLGRVSRIGVIATAGDRRDGDMRSLGHEAAQHFDVLIVREDANPRGRAAGEVAELVVQGARQGRAEGARCKQIETVLDELASVRHAMSRSNPGDLVVICVEQHAAVMALLESYGHHAQPGARPDDDREFSNAVPDPDFTRGATRDEPEPVAMQELP
jgi:cyanophycin synthetase